MRQDRRHAIWIVLLAALWGGCAGVAPPPAVGPQSSWDEIRGTPGLVLQPPEIPFGVRTVSVMDVCLSGGTLRATTGDGTALEKPAAGVPQEYRVGVGRIVGDGERGGIRIFFYKPFSITACK